MSKSRADINIGRIEQLPLIMVFWEIIRPLRDHKLITSGNVFKMVWQIVTFDRRTAKSNTQISLINFKHLSWNR
jgi:hypothetical protein